MSPERVSMVGMGDSLVPGEGRVASAGDLVILVAGSTPRVSVRGGALVILALPELLAVLWLRKIDLLCDSKRHFHQPSSLDGTHGLPIPT